MRKRVVVEQEMGQAFGFDQYDGIYLALELGGDVVSVASEGGWLGGVAAVKFRRSARRKLRA